MIASGSSERGLSEVTTQASASRAAISPISGRFSRSRSPPHPKTAISRPSVSLRAAVERVVQRVGGVGVVDQDRERLPLVHRLETSRDAARPRQGGGRRLGGHAEHVAGADRGECVLDVEVARERHPHLDLPAGTEAAKPRPGSVEGSVERPEVGLLCARAARR